MFRHSSSDRPVRNSPRGRSFRNKNSEAIHDKPYSASYQQPYRTRYSYDDRGERNDTFAGPALRQPRPSLRADWRPPDSSSRTPMDYTGRYSQDYETRRRPDPADDSYLMGHAAINTDEDFDRWNEREYSYQPNHAGKGPKNYRRSDDRIREDVSEALAEHSRIDASEIDVAVSDAIVTLSGTVESRQIKRLAEDCAETVAGVRDVRNELRIMSGIDSAHWGSQKSMADNKASAEKTTSAPKP